MCRPLECAGRILSPYQEEVYVESTGQSMLRSGGNVGSSGNHKLVLLHDMVDSRLIAPVGRLFFGADGTRMPLLNMSIKHGQTFDEAKVRLDEAVREIQSRFGAVVDRVEWSTDRTQVKLTGKGVVAEMRVDGENVHVTGDIPALGGLLGGVFRRGLESVVKTTFRKGLPG